MLYHLIVAFAGLGVLMTGWFWWQAILRRNTPGAAPDCDILEGRWGCHGDGCLLHGSCDT